MNGEHSNAPAPPTTDLVSMLDECWKHLDPTDITSGYDTEVIAGASVLLARAAHRLQELECEHAALLLGRKPTHRCKDCGALWIDWGDSWSLFSLHCGKCCDNAAMGDQIEALPVIGQSRLIAAAPDLLAIAKQCASECAGCSGAGTWARVTNVAGPAIREPCEDCADIRKVIDKAEGRS